MRQFFSRLFMFVVLAVVLVGIAWVVVSILNSFIDSPQERSMPSVEEATYSVRIENTGNLLLTGKYEKTGSIYTLDGFWELSGQNWSFKASDLILDETIFGKITIKRRR